MNNTLEESKKLALLVFNEEQINSLNLVLDEIKKNPERYNTSLLWKIDHSIGQIGGYCMPPDPKINPFPGGIGRSLFRPLQYARSEIDIMNINYTARYVVQNSGMHLEAAVRFILKSEKIMGSLRFNNTTLGKAVRILEKSNLSDADTLNGLYHFIPLFNKAKHEINQDEDRERLFSPSDALIAYLSSRIIGNRLLDLYYPTILLQIGSYIHRLANPRLSLSVKDMHIS